VTASLSEGIHVEPWQLRRRWDTTVSMVVLHALALRIRMAPVSKG
jgi:hypothetical protein